MEKAAACVVYRPESREFLVLKRSDSREEFPGLWEFPGGYVEEDETPEEAAFRELREETELTPELVRSGEPGNLHGTEVHPFLFVTSEEEIELSEEHVEYRWLEKEKIEGMEEVEGTMKELEALGIDG